MGFNSSLVTELIIVTFSSILCNKIQEREELLMWVLLGSCQKLFCKCLPSDFCVDIIHLLGYEVYSFEFDIINSSRVKRYYICNTTN